MKRLARFGLWFEVGLPPGFEVPDSQWELIGQRVAVYVAARLGRKGRRADVEELTQETIRRILDPTYKCWNGLGTLESFAIKNVARGLCSNFVRLRRYNDESLLRPARVFSRIESEGGVVETPLERILVATDPLLMRLRAKVRGDPLASQVCEAALNGFAGTAELARHLEVSVAEIVNAKRRLRRLVERIRYREDQLRASGGDGWARSLAERILAPWQAGALKQIQGLAVEIEGDV